MTQDEKPKQFATDAKLIVDTMFDTKIFADHITRDDMNGFEDLIQYTLEHRFESYKKAWHFTEKLKQKPQV